MPRAAIGAVGLAADTRIIDLPRQPRPGHFMHVAGAASNDLDSVACQDVHGSAAHVSGQHHRDSHAGQLWYDARLAPAAGRGRHRLFRHDDIVVLVNGKNCEALAVAKVLIDFRTFRR